MPAPARLPLLARRSSAPQTSIDTWALLSSNIPCFAYHGQLCTSRLCHPPLHPPGTPPPAVWCALDDMTLSNGCLVVRPGSHLRDGGPRASTDARAEQQEQQGTLRPCKSSSMGQQQQQQQRRQQQQQQQEQQRRQQQQQQQEQQQQHGLAAAPAARPGAHEEQPPTQQAAGVLPLEVPAGTAIVTSDTVLHCSGPNRSRHMRRAWMPQFSSGPICWSGGGCVSLAVPLAPGPAVADC